ncbi:MAG: serine/threonine protein kinase, partial [Planctomycetota bacterium]
MAQVGAQVGACTLETEIGRGGTGVVYRARAADGRVVALKTVALPDADKRARFARERRLLARLGEVDGFVPFVDSGEMPSGAFLVMPLLEGG